jgi:hypothetical protein
LYEPASLRESFPEGPRRTFGGDLMMASSELMGMLKQLLFSEDRAAK